MSADPLRDALEQAYLGGMFALPEDGDHRWCDEDSGGHRFDRQSWLADLCAALAPLTSETTDSLKGGYKAWYDRGYSEGLLAALGQMPLTSAEDGIRASSDYDPLPLDIEGASARPEDMARSAARFVAGREGPSETTDAGLPGLLQHVRRVGFPVHRGDEECFCDTCWSYLVEDNGGGNPEAALSSSGSIDAERLARAEWEVFGGARATGSTWDEQEPAHRDRMLAHMRDVAAEYARLSESVE